MHTDIADHIARFPGHTQVQLKELHHFIDSKVPNLTQKMGYGIPTFQLRDKNFIHYAGHSKHIGLYPGAKAIAHFANAFERRGYKYSKGAVQFPINQELPQDLILEILTYLLSRMP
jgi:uncharacterized protein YdhG (YjbR/CyaY superfamily)